MYGDSHKAQRNSFAHHRAELLFSTERAVAGDDVESPVDGYDATQSAATPAEARRQRVRAGLLGFVSAGIAPAL